MKRIDIIRIATKGSFLSLKLDHSLTSKISVALLKKSYEIIVNLISMVLYNNNDTCTEYIRIAKKKEGRRFQGANQ